MLKQGQPVRTAYGEIGEVIKQDGIMVLVELTTARTFWYHHTKVFAQ